ncbi:MAG: hypothetical protein ACI97A_002904, partial [Planctomycetota bacterium]
PEISTQYGALSLHWAVKNNLTPYFSWRTDAVLVVRRRDAAEPCATPPRVVSRILRMMDRAIFLHAKYQGDRQGKQPETFTWYGTPGNWFARTIRRA